MSVRKVWWCDVHERSSDTIECDREGRPGVRDGRRRYCRMVDALIIDDVDGLPASAIEAGARAAFPNDYNEGKDDIATGIAELIVRAFLAAWLSEDTKSE